MTRRNFPPIPRPTRRRAGCGSLLLVFFGCYIFSTLCGTTRSFLPKVAEQPTNTPTVARLVLTFPTQPSGYAAGSQQAAAQPVQPAVSASAAGSPITVAAWNAGLDDADVNVIAQRIAAFQGVGLWGIEEVNRESAVPTLEKAAEDGEPGDFRAVLGKSGDAQKLLALYDDSRFDLLESYELDNINTTGNVRAPLVLHLRDNQTGVQFLFMVNHLYRSKDDERHKQAQLLNEWAVGKSLPIIAVGDYNFDWDVVRGDQVHDAGYDLMTKDGVWQWVQPAQLVLTQCTGWPCRYVDVLDFAFVAGPAKTWRAESEIVTAPGDFPDDITKSDHRPILARFWPSGAGASVALAEPTPILPTPAVQPPAQPVPPEPPAAPPPAPTATTTPLPPTPTATPEPPAPTPLPLGPIVNSGANLRGGPGTNYPVVGSAAAGQQVVVDGRSAAGDWLHLASGMWIAAFLVDNPPGGLGIVAAPAAPEPPAPVRAAAVTQIDPPTPTPIPQWNPPVNTSGGSSACCKICRAGKACGDSCISRSKTCHKGAGCACDG